MPSLMRLVAAMLLWTGGVQAQASLARCGGDAWELAAAAERALLRGDWPGSARLYGCAAAGSEDPALAERATRTAFENGQYREAVRQARRWLAIQPASESARRHLATGLLRLYDDAGAAAEFEQLLATAYDDRARGSMVLLGILADEGNETGAARVMERLAAAHADVAEAQYAASVLWERAEDGGRALAAARRAIALRQDWRLAELAEVRALAARGERAAALERVATLAADGDLYTKISQAWLLLGADRRDEAAAIFEELRRAGGPATGDAIAGLTALALDERRFDDARRLQDGVARDAQQAEAVQWNLARIAEERGEDGEAARHYERIKGGARAVPAQLRAYRLWRAQGQPER
ncbi:MAG TPA: hypothetical protein VFR29_08735, partial [Steroidobacteraceae bacterium]|nr:hypothetical protein [Steroidobacteraceae bacterium]